jgi:hypothetical protein
MQPSASTAFRTHSQLVEQPKDTNTTYLSCTDNRLLRALAREDVDAPLVVLAEQFDGIAGKRRGDQFAMLRGAIAAAAAAAAAAPAAPAVGATTAVTHDLGLQQGKGDIKEDTSCSSSRSTKSGATDGDTTSPLINYMLV